MPRPVGSAPGPLAARAVLGLRTLFVQCFVHGLPQRAVQGLVPFEGLVGVEPGREAVVDPYAVIVGAGPYGLGQVRTVGARERLTSRRTVEADVGLRLAPEAELLGGDRGRQLDVGCAAVRCAVVGCAVVRCAAVGLVRPVAGRRTAVSRRLAASARTLRPPPGAFLGAS